MSPLATALLALVLPVRPRQGGDATIAPLRPDRLPPHLLRDIGLADGRPRAEPERWPDIAGR